MPYFQNKDEKAERINLNLIVENHFELTIAKNKNLRCYNFCKILDKDFQ